MCGLGAFPRLGDMDKTLVRALRDFEYEGITAAKGQILEVTPLQASILGRAHHVNLSEHISRPDPEPQTRALVPEPQVETPKPKRTYRRRDKRAEP